MAKNYLLWASVSAKGLFGAIVAFAQRFNRYFKASTHICLPHPSSSLGRNTPHCHLDLIWVGLFPYQTATCNMLLLSSSVEASGGHLGLLMTTQQLAVHFITQFLWEINLHSPVDPAPLPSETCDQLEERQHPTSKASRVFGLAWVQHQPHSVGIQTDGFCCRHCSNYNRVPKWWRWLWNVLGFWNCCTGDWGRNDSSSNLITEKSVQIRSTCIG